jgi:nicotinamidase-related amidase
MTELNSAGSDTALLVIDVQESFRQRESWSVSSNPEIVERVGQLVGWARARGHLVVWVLHVEPGTGTVFDPELGHVRLMTGLTAREGEPTLTKTSHNVFTTTDIGPLLVSRGVRGLVVCGVKTEQCCETTARIGSDLGYRVTFVTDATATTPIEHWDAPAGRPLAEVLADPRTLGVHEITERTEYALAGRFARIATIADVVAEPATAAATR